MSTDQEDWTNRRGDGSSGSSSAERRSKSSSRSVENDESRLQSFVHSVSPPEHDHSSTVEPLKTAQQISDEESTEKFVSESPKERSLAAKRLYRAISHQERYSKDEALGYLLKEVIEKPELTEEELIKKLGSHTLPADESDSEPEIETHELDDEKLQDNNMPTEEEKTKLEKAEEEAVTLEILGFGRGAAVQHISNIIHNRFFKSNIDSLVDYVLKRLQEQWRNIVYVLFPLHQIQTLMCICIVQLISFSRLFSLIPVLLCYCAFAVMVYNTLAMFHSKKLLHEAEIWQRLLRVFTRKQESNKIHEESLYTVGSMEPYANFVVALLVFVVSFGFVGSGLPNCLFLCAISVFFSLLCFVTLADNFDKWALWTLLLNVFSSSPILMSKCHIHVWPLLQPVLSVRMGLINLSIGLPSLAFMMIPFIYLYLATTMTPSKFFHKVALSHAVVFLWSELAICLFLKSRLSWQPFTILLTLGCISLLLWPSTAGLVLVSGLLLTQLRTSVTALNLLKATVTLVLLLLPFVYKKTKQIMMKRYGWKDTVQQNARNWILLAAYVLLVLMAIAMLYHGRLGFEMDKDVTDLKWQQFESVCHTEAQSNQLQNQYACSQLKGLAIRWKGSIQNVKIVKIDNSLENLLDYLPDSFDDWLRCFYGTKNNQTDQISSLLKNRPKGCTVSEHNVYTYEIEVSGPFGEHMISSAKGTVVLVAGHAFKEILGILDEGDVVRFVAYFEKYPVPRYPPRLKLLSLECVTCKNLMKLPPKISRNIKTVTTVSDFYTGYLWSKIFSAFKFLFNFVLAPLLILK